MEPLERVTVLLTLIRRLQDIMESENLLVRSMTLDRLEDLQDEKKSLAEAYELEMRHIRKSPEFVAAVDIEIREILQEAIRDLRAAMRTNMETLAAAQTVLEGLVRRLGNSAASVSGAGAYGPGVHGPGANGQRDGQPQIVSIAFSQHI